MGFHAESRKYQSSAKWLRRYAHIKPQRTHTECVSEISDSVRLDDSPVSTEARMMNQPGPKWDAYGGGFVIISIWTIVVQTSGSRTLIGKCCFVPNFSSDRARDHVMPRSGFGGGTAFAWGRSPVDAALLHVSIPFRAPFARTCIALDDGCYTYADRIRWEMLQN